jgi:serine/threonine-protein kinase HipA
MPDVLTVALNAYRVGTLTSLSGDYILFNFDAAYIEDSARPVLSQAFIGMSGEPVRIVPRTHRVAPPFFANLLPEEGSILRALIARQYEINRNRDFPYLRALGRDLPGAVVLDEVGGSSADGTEQDVAAPPALTPPPLRFSLAGVQLKFSVKTNDARLAVPLGGTEGSWIAKLPTTSFPRLPENEFAIMTLARRVGLPVPEIRMVALDAIDGLPSDLPALRADEPRMCYVIRRFDRREDGTRVHAEDLNQIANQPPEEKYEHRTSSWIANVVATLCPQDDVDDFIRRLIFGVCVGNNDMHLKNWSVTYPDGRNARLAPVYDYVCTRAYYPNGELALTIGGERSFERIGRDALRSFAQRAEISARRAQVLADETVTAIREAWPCVRDELGNPDFTSAVERNFALVPLMNGR